MQHFVSELNDFIVSICPLPTGLWPGRFEWINSISANENMLVSQRNTEKKEDTILVVANFSPVTYEKRKIGVPWPENIEEIFNSDRKNPAAAEPETPSKTIQERRVRRQEGFHRLPSHHERSFLCLHRDCSQSGYQPGGKNG